MEEENMRISQPLRLLGLAAVALCAALVAGCGSSGTNSAKTGGATPQTKNKGAQQNGAAGSIASVCGTKPLVVGYLKSVGGNSWVTQSAAEFKDEASKCPNVKKAMFSQAINDQQKAISDINSFVAQGVNVLVISADYGAPELPAIRKATQAGVKVVTILGNAGGAPGTDFVDSVVFDTQWIGQQWATFLHQQLPKGGKVAYLGGTPGNETSTAFYAGVSSALKAYPNLKWVTKTWIPTDWDPAKKQKAMTGLLAKNGRIDAVVTDFNGTDTGILPAYKSAGMKPPVMASITPNNAIGCQWQKTPYPLMTMGQTSSMPRLALRLGLAAANGKTDSEADKLRPEPLVFAPGGKQAPCNSKYPPDADLTANLSAAQLNAIFKG
jgi:ribose transport system substrate-binding protein